MRNNPAIDRIPILSLLKGCYAQSYTAYWLADPPYKPIAPNNKIIPQLGAFTESLTNPGHYTQVDGYAVASFAGYICFDGTGKLEGKGKSNRGGVSITDISYKGSYILAFDLALGVFTGTFQTKAGANDFINHYFVVADNWKELHFILLDTNLKQPVTSGCMRKI